MRRSYRSTFRNSRFLIFIVCSLVAVLTSARAFATDLSPRQERGKDIYFTGRSPYGDPITAYFGEDLMEIPGATATCGSCHGYDGLGRPESGVIPTNITWKYLTKTYGHVHPNGAEHPPFTKESLKTYMLSGHFPGGGKGDPSMPVYAMTDRDMDDLIAFMKLVGELQGPGISEAEIRIGTILPSIGPLGEIGVAIEGILKAEFEKINRAGGIYGRRIELVTHKVTPIRDSAPAQVLGWLAEQQPFALVSTFTPEADSDVQAALSGESIPLVGPITLYPLHDFSLNRNIFYIYSGILEQIQALVQYVGLNAGIKEPRVAMLYPKTGDLDEVIAGTEQACRDRGWEVVRKVAFPQGYFDLAGAVDKMKEDRANIVILLSIEGQTRSFMEAATSKNWVPTVLTPGVLAGRIVKDAHKEFEKRLFLAYPTLKSDRQQSVFNELLELMKENDLPKAHIQATIAAYVSAKILVEALRKSGKDLSREKFVSALEKFYRFDTGLTPSMTYTRNRRIGAQGAYIVTFSTESESGGGPFESASWVDVN